MVFPEYKTVKVANLVPYARNSRTHSVEQVAQIAASIREFGFSLDEIAELEFDSDCETDMPELNDGDKEPFQQKTFTLHDEQAAVVDDAVTLARTSPLADTGLNENSNGNALTLICQQWLEAQHGDR